MTRNLKLKGHGLLQRGACGYDADGTPLYYFDPVKGYAKCGCGLVAPTPGMSRRDAYAWGRQHKLDVIEITLDVPGPGKVRWTGDRMEFIPDTSEPLHEHQCAACGATTRVRMADQQ